MFESIEVAITGFLQHNNNPVGFVLLGLSAMVEYLFPPFPGDTVTLFGAFLITRHDWSLPLVFLAVMIGSGLGSMADFYAGVWFKKRYEKGRFLKSPRARRAVDRVVAGFAKHGEAYVVVNRFLPAVRAVFFVAAGMAGLRPWRVLLFALLSAAAWNALIIGAGYAVGANWERIQELFRVYSVAAWSVVGAALLFFLVRWYVQGRKEANQSRKGANKE